MSAQAEEVQDENKDAETLIQQALSGEQEEAQEEEAPREYSAIEKEAMDMGPWKPKDEFVAEGGDPDVWSTAREFVKYGKLQQNNKDLHAKIDRQGKDFDSRVENLNKLHEVQQQAKIRELKEKQRIAVSEADTESYDSAQKQIDAINEQETTDTAETKDPLVATWEANNPWVLNPTDPKTYAANGIFSNFLSLNPGATTAEALAHLDTKLAETFPKQVETNPRRDTAATTETAGRTTSRGKQRGLTMSDLNSDERDMWRNGAVLFNNDEKQFLKACEDARKGA